MIKLPKKPHIIPVERRHPAGKGSTVFTPKQAKAGKDGQRRSCGNECVCGLAAGDLHLRPNDGERFEQALAAQALADRGDELMEKKEFAVAKALFSETCGLDATQFQALNNLGAIRLARKDYAGALEAFRQADRLVDLPRIKKNLAYLAGQRVTQ